MRIAYKIVIIIIIYTKTMNEIIIVLIDKLRIIYMYCINT